MSLAIMQPYFFPYIGYFQLLKRVDKFVVYDNIEYTKKGWINRNRILENGKDAYITLPLKKDSDYLHVRGRYLSDIWKKERIKMLNRIYQSYKRAPCFSLVYPVVEKCILFEDDNLFNFIFHSVATVNAFLQINTPLIIASGIPIDHGLKSEKKVIAICKAMNASEYINPSGGYELYSKENFNVYGIKLQFLQPAEIEYKQFGNEFVSALSVIDVMMFNSVDVIAGYLESYSVTS
jgi:WbqC-like protein family